MVGLVGNLAAAALIWQGYYTLGGVAFIIGSVMDTLDGRYARASGKGPCSAPSSTPPSTGSRRGSS